MVECFTSCMVKLFKYLMKQTDYEKSNAVITVLDPKSVRIDLNIFVKDMDEAVKDFTRKHKEEFISESLINDAYNELIEICRLLDIYRNGHFYISSTANSDLYAIIPHRVINHLNTKYNERKSVLCYPIEEPYPGEDFDFAYYFLVWLYRYRANDCNVVDISKDSSSPSKVYQFRVSDMRSAISRYVVLNPYFKIYSKNHLRKVVHKWVNCGMCQRQSDGTMIFTISSSNKTHAKYTERLALFIH